MEAKAFLAFSRSGFWGILLVSAAVVSGCASLTAESDTKECGLSANEREKADVALLQLLALENPTLSDISQVFDTLPAELRPVVANRMLSAENTFTNAKDKEVYREYLRALSTSLIEGASERARRDPGSYFYSVNPPILRKPGPRTVCMETDIAQAVEIGEEFIHVARNYYSQYDLPLVAARFIVHAIGACVQVPEAAELLYDIASGRLRPYLSSSSEFEVELQHLSQSMLRQDALEQFLKSGSMLAYERGLSIIRSAKLPSCLGLIGTWASCVTDKTLMLDILVAAVVAKDDDAYKESSLWFIYQYGLQLSESFGSACIDGAAVEKWWSAEGCKVSWKEKSGGGGLIEAADGLDAHQIETRKARLKSLVEIMKRSSRHR